MHSTIHNIVSIFEEAVSKNPDKIALIEGRRRLSYTALNAKVRNASIRYQALGIEKGTKVLVLIPISIDLYINILALFKIGASIIFVDEWSKKERLEACIKTVGIDVLVSGWKGKILRYFHPSLRQIPRSIVYQDVLSPNSVEEVSIKGKDSALVTYTTGSTGSPKAANRTHRFLYAQFIELKNTLQHNEIEVLMTTLPIIVLLGLGLNKTVVLPRYNYKSAADSDFDALGMDLLQHQVDTFITSPFILDELVKTESSYKGLRSIYVGGASIFKESAKRWKHKFTSSKIELIYGSTEVEPIAKIPIDDFLDTKATHRGTCVGRVNKNLDLKIVDIHQSTPSSYLEVEDGSIGEIIVAGDHVLEDYLGDTSIIRRSKIQEGKLLWHRTGDAGYVLDGVLYLVGRASQMISLKGQTYGIFEVEEYLKSFRHVKNGTVMKKEGESFVVLEGYVSSLEKEIIQNYLGNAYFIDSFKIPMDPRHHSKIDYPSLRRLLHQQYTPTVEV